MTLKLNIIGRRRPGTTLAEHRHHIRHVHGNAVLRFIEAEADVAPRRYVQNAVFDGQYRASAVGNDPFALSLDFVTQIWVDDAAMLERSRRSDFYMEHLKDDEDRFVDQATVTFLPCRERELQAHGPVSAGAVKLFVLAQRAQSIAMEDYVAAWQAAAQDAGALAQRHVQNDVLGHPNGATQAADAIDEFWLPDEASARKLLASWRAVLDRRLVLPGLATAGSVIALLAHEDVVHEGGGTGR